MMSSAIPTAFDEAGAAEGGGDDLVMTASRTEQIAEFAMLTAKAFSRLVVLEAPHPSNAALDAAMVLFKTIIIRHDFRRRHRRAGRDGAPAVSWVNQDRGVGSTWSGQAELFDELRARIIIWPPLRLAWVRCERGSVSVVLPIGSRDVQQENGGGTCGLSDWTSTAASRWWQ